MEITVIIDYRTKTKSVYNLSNSHLGKKSPWTKVCLDNYVIGQKSLGQLSPWTIIPWTIVATPVKSYVQIKMSTVLVHSTHLT